ncbi:hypothetical protein HYH02_001988 [Chlamydomonas schloesseri]|uniref:Uncharacterized protein n=1 Tax=Chlamydomonas schloesseri TaxID=2026947 RepID=A0A835WT84_9CHLO|nr:hypothetical protein HYH02_001988 [Chlamydomonas schloesseri]|eukprot:KAG2453778.1 hypothetical protein HYH02_001988 [Chlamydomonas schloesseri]
MSLPKENFNAIVGMCFLPKKLPRVLTPQLRQLAATAGLQLVALEPHAGHGLGFQLPRTTAPRADSTGSAAAPPSRVVTAAAAVEQAQGGRSLTSTSEFNRPLDVIVHKLHRDEVWEAALAAYAAAHPTTVVLDPPAAIHATEDRAVMLAAAVPAAGLTLRVPLRLQASQVPGSNGSGAGEDERGGGLEGGPGRQDADTVKVEVEVEVEAPHQVVVETREELRQLVAEGRASASGVAAGGLRPPLLVKTRRTDAASGSGHGVAVVRCWAELEQQAAALQPPVASLAAEAAGGGSGSTGSVPEATVTAAAGGPAPGDALGPFEPLVVQQYVPHSQELYKVYVLGRHVRVERRATLTQEQVGARPGGGGAGGDAEAQQGSGGIGAVGARAAGSHVSVVHRISTAPLAHHATTTSAPVVSGGAAPADSGAGGAADGAAPAAAATGTADDGDGGTDVDEAVLAAVARALSTQLGLTMFNFDLVLPVDQPLSQEAGGGAGGVTERGEAVGLLPYDALPEDGGDRAAKRRRHMAEDQPELKPEPEPEPRQERMPRRLRLCVVDVNYWPGFDKIQGWEAMLVEHLRAAADESLAARRLKAPAVLE